MAKSPKRKDYLKDYKQGDDGRYTYGGKTYKYADTEQERLKAYRNLIILAVVLLASIAASGLNDSACAIRSFYVILPFLGEVCAFFALAWYLSKLMFEGREIRGYIFETANNRIPPAALILMFFALLGLMTAAIYLMIHGFDGEIFKSILYLVLKACNASLAFCFKKYYNTLQWTVI